MKRGKGRERTGTMGGKMRDKDTQLEKKTSKVYVHLVEFGYLTDNSPSVVYCSQPLLHLFPLGNTGQPSLHLSMSVILFVIPPWSFIILY